MSSVRCAASDSAARLLVLTVRPAMQSPANLDFLYPAFSRRTSTCYFRPIRSFAVQSLQNGNRIPGFRYGAQTHQSFSTTSVQRKTICAVNPAKDYDGISMHMDITPRAAKRLHKVMTRDNKPGLALKIEVESGGCHGFQYVMSLVNLPEPGSSEWPSAVTEEDTIFQYVADDADEPGDLYGAPKIILDEPSLALLKDSKVDFTSELIGSQFKVDNPRATSSCGCGTSFDMQL